MNELLEKLSKARGVAGHEGEVRAILREELAPHVEELSVDSIGNLIVRKGGSDSSVRHRVMLAAHMDEVGGMVMRVNGDGTVKFSSVGGLDPRILPGKRGNDWNAGSSWCDHAGAVCCPIGKARHADLRSADRHRRRRGY